jgi:hypothetical protein
MDRAMNPTPELIHRRSVDEPCQLVAPGDVDQRIQWIRHARATLHLTTHRAAVRSQLAALAIALQDFGLRSRDQQIGACSLVIGRPLATRRELSSREADAILVLLALETAKNPVPLGDRL